MPEWVRLPLLIVGIMFGGAGIVIGVGELTAWAMRRARRNSTGRKQKERSGEANSPR